MFSGRRSVAEAEWLFSYENTSASGAILLTGGGVHCVEQASFFVRLGAAGRCRHRVIILWPYCMRILDDLMRTVCTLLRTVCP